MINSAHINSGDCSPWPFILRNSADRGPGDKGTTSLSPVYIYLNPLYRMIVLLLWGEITQAQG